MVPGRSKGQTRPRPDRDPLLRKKNITGSYVALLGKKGQEDYVQKTNIATELIALLEPEFSLDWKGHEIHGKGSYHGPWA